jgi:hypothetical protein
MYNKYITPALCLVRQGKGIKSRAEGTLKIVENATFCDAVVHMHKKTRKMMRVLLKLMKT